jgi:hypothetical protein
MTSRRGAQWFLGFEERGSAEKSLFISSSWGPSSKGSLFNITGLPSEIRVASMHKRNCNVISTRTRTRGYWLLLARFGHLRIDHDLCLSQPMMASSQGGIEDGANTQHVPTLSAARPTRTRWDGLRLVLSWDYCQRTLYAAGIPLSLRM